MDSLWGWIWGIAIFAAIAFGAWWVWTTFFVDGA
jgi:hypothetical protein